MKNIDNKLKEILYVFASRSNTSKYGEDATEAVAQIKQAFEKADIWPDENLESGIPPQELDRGY